MHKLFSNPSQFPNIYRFFPDISLERKFFYLKITLVSFVTGFLAMAVAIKGYEITQAFLLLRKASAQESYIREERTYWEDVVKRHPGYRDAYFKLAILSFQLGEREKAKEYLQEVFLIDPNFEEGRKLAKELGLEKE